MSPLPMDISTDFSFRKLTDSLTVIINIHLKSLKILIFVKFEVMLNHFKFKKINKDEKNFYAI